MDASGKLIKEIKAGRIYPVYLLLGEDRGGKDEFIRFIREFIHEYIIYFGDEAIIEEIIETLATFSIFSDRKLIIIHNFDKLKSLKPLIDYINSPNDKSVLVLVTDKKSVSKEFQEAVTGIGRAEIFWPLFENESEKWFVQRLNRLGFSAEPEAVKYIVTVSGTGRSNLIHQVELISNYLGEDKHLTIDLARYLVTKLIGYTVFDLSNALFVKRSRDLIGIFRHLVNNGEDLVKMEYFCMREIGKILKAHRIKERGDDYVGLLGLRKMEASRIGFILRSTSREMFQNLYDLAYNLDHTIKTSPKEVGLITFERFLSNLGR